MKIFLWRLCRNTIPVRRRLSNKGVQVPWLCPMCNNDVEHLAHVFFDCNFASACWSEVHLNYDMSMVEDIPKWVIEKLSTGSSTEITKVCAVLWGIWN